MLKKAFSLLLILALAASARANSASVEVPQGRIWRLLETGYINQADLLEKSLEDYLKSSPLNQVAYLGGGISNSFLVKFNHNVYAVLKLSDPHVPDSYLHEIAAYKLDRLLGLHMVPLTVARTINGQSYSLQLFYPGEGIKKDAPEDFQKRRDDLKVFDYLISQSDRQGDSKNLFIAQDGRIIAIDQARVFLPYSPQELNTSNYGQPSDRMKIQILNLKEKDVRDTLKDLLSEENIQQIFIRLSELKENFSKNPPSPIKPQKQKEPWPHMKDEFKAPDHISQFEFWDQFGVWKTLTRQKGKRLTSEALQMIQENSTPAKKKKLLGFVFQRWFHFTNEVKYELLTLLWSPDAILVLKNYLPVLREILHLDPSKADEISQRQSPHRLGLALTCAKIHL